MDENYKYVYIYIKCFILFYIYHIFTFNIKIMINNMWGIFKIFMYEIWYSRDKNWTSF